MVLLNRAISDPEIRCRHADHGYHGDTMVIPGRSWPVTAVSGHSPHDLENSPQWFL